MSNLERIEQGGAARAAETFPLVLPDDDGIRPAGAPDECFYCRSKVGFPHKPDCAVVTKKVRVRYSFEVEIEVPHHWTQENVEFHRNESSWCANNGISELVSAFGLGEHDSEKGCACGSFLCEYLEISDPTPRGSARQQTAKAQ